MEIISDRVLSFLLSMVVIGLIALSAGAALWLAYGGVVELCNGRFAEAFIMLVAVGIPAAGCYGLCRCRNDLMDR